MSNFKSKSYKILKHATMNSNKKRFVGTCPACKCEFECLREDLQGVMDKRHVHKSYTGHTEVGNVKCPTPGCPNKTVFMEEVGDVGVVKDEE